MTAPTHKQYSVTFVLLTAILMYSNGIFTKNFNSIQPNYYLALLMMLPIAKIGAKFPDVDHEWEFVKDKTVVNRVINLLIHMTGGKHRSWQTHSIDIVVWCTLALCYIPDILIERHIVSVVNGKLIYLIALAFMSGWISHIFSDMLNGVGVRVFFFLDFKVAFVPRKFLWIHFNTGEAWEEFNFFIIRIINIALGIIAIAYPYAQLKIEQILQYAIK